MADKYWFELDHAVVAANDDTLSLTIKDILGNPVSVVGWSDMTYKASADWTTDTVLVADAAMSQTSSGTGVTDTIVMPLSTAVTDKDTGMYNHEFSCTIATQTRTIFRGTLRILTEIAEVP